MDWPDIILQGCALIGLQVYSWTSCRIFINHAVVAAPSWGVPRLIIGLLAAASISEQACLRNSRCLYSLYALLCFKIAEELLDHWDDSISLQTSR